MRKTEAQDLLIQCAGIRLCTTILADTSISLAYNPAYKGNPIKGRKYLYPNSYKTWEGGRSFIKTIRKRLQQGIAQLQTGVMIPNAIILVDAYRCITQCRNNVWRQNPVEIVANTFLFIVLQEEATELGIEEFLHYYSGKYTTLED